MFLYLCVYFCVLSSVCVYMAWVMRMLSFLLLSLVCE